MKLESKKSLSSTLIFHLDDRIQLGSTHCFSKHIVARITRFRHAVTSHLGMTLVIQSHMRENYARKESPQSLAILLGHDILSSSIPTRILDARKNTFFSLDPYIIVLSVGIRK